MRYLGRFDEAIASIALVLMAVIPLIEILVRPFMGKGIENAPLFVQHMGLVLAMWGAIAAERHGHLTSLGRLFNQGEQFAHIAASVICGVLTWASWQFVWSEIATPKELAYGIPVWWLQATMPLGFAILGAKLAARGQDKNWVKAAFALVWPLVGIAFAAWLDGEAIVLWP
jgi:TRAP-type C4-dicarboxylate transport system permease small subunit